MKIVLLFIALLAAPSLRAECLQDGYPVADQCSERIPARCIQGKLNHNFRWMPSAGEIVLHVYVTNVRPWLVHTFYPAVLKYAPTAVKTIVNYQKDKNAVILAVPVVLKYLKKF